jgi:hypothetical protein
MWSVYAASMLLMFSACTNNDDASLTLMKVAEASASGYTITLQSEKLLAVGNNTVYWEVKNTAGARQTIQTITAMPVMAMATMSHSCPMTLPALSEEVNGAWQQHMVFTMPSGDMGSWTVTVNVTLADGTPLSAVIPVTIASSWRLASVRLNNVPHYIVWDLPETPKMGNATYRLLVYKRISMMEYAPVSDAVVTIYPYMDMGGGTGHSTTFTDPAAKGMGAYEGTVNFSMAGEWSVTVRTSIGGIALPDAVLMMNVIAR